MEDQSQPNRRSVRLQWLDYRSAGFYFVTICTHDRRYAFGEVVNGTMRLNAVGAIAQAQWVILSQRFAGVLVDRSVVMPNHVHGIIVIYKATNITQVPTRFQPSRQKMIEEHNPALSVPYQPPSLGQIVRTYKAATCRLIRKAGAQDFSWQGNYFDIAIRSDEQLAQIRQYVLDNPTTWERDKLYTSNPKNTSDTDRHQ